MNIIVDENIRLELTTKKHAAELFNAVNNNRDRLAKFLRWVDAMQSVEDCKAFIQNCEMLYQQKKEVSFVIICDEQLIGRIGLYQVNMQNKLAHIGYWLDKNFEGKGIVIKCCRAIINYGFEVLDLHRIEIKTATNNQRSQAIPEKLKFKKEGILREAEFVSNEFQDLVLFSMLSHEWAKARDSN